MVSGTSARTILSFRPLSSGFRVDNFHTHTYNSFSMAQEKIHPTPFQKAACWNALTWACVVFLVILVCGLLYGFVKAFVALEPVLLPVIIAGALGYLLNPCVNWVQRRLTRRRPIALLLLIDHPREISKIRKSLKLRRRALAVLTVMCGVSLLVSILGAIIVPPLVSQTKQLVADRNIILPKAVATSRDFLESNPLAQYAVDSFYDRVQSDAKENSSELEQLPATTSLNYTDKLLVSLDYHSKDITNMVIRWLTAGTRALYGSVGLLVGLVLIPVFLFYFLLHSQTIRKNWEIIIPIRASGFREEVIGTLSEINDYIVAFLRGQMLVSIIDGFLLGCALMIMGLPYAVTIGVAAALLGIIPYIGMIATSIPALLLAWVTWHDAGHVLAVLIIFLSVSQLDGWILQPKILGERLHMHDMTIMLSVLLWGSILGGIVGALLAVPLTASLKVLFRRYVWPTLHHAPKS